VNYYADSRVVVNLEKLAFAQRKNVVEGKKILYLLLLTFDGQENDLDVEYGNEGSRDRAYERIVELVSGKEMEKEKIVEETPPATIARVE